MTPARCVRPIRLHGALAALLLATSSCFIFNRGKADRPPGVEVAEGEIALTVTNHNYLDVVVYVIHDGVQTRVGTVTGESVTAAISPRVLSLTSAITASMCAIDVESSTAKSLT